MFNRRLNANIKKLDLQIGQISDELSQMAKDGKYDVTVEKLKTLTEVRTQLAKGLKDNEKSDALVEMDKQIEELTMKLAHLIKDEVYAEKLEKLDELTKVRCQLADSKFKGSKLAVWAPPVIAGSFGIASTLMILKHEKTDIITSKAWNTAMSLFRGK